MTIVAMLLLVSVTSCTRQYEREQAEKDASSKGRQTLLEAESSKKAKIEESKAHKESAALEAEALIIEAEGKAKAFLIEEKGRAEARQIYASSRASEIQTLGKSLKGNEEFQRYQAIESIKSANTVYVPTEANVPIIQVKK